LAARYAYLAHNFPLATRFAERAARIQADQSIDRWRVEVWLYPPAFDSLFAALPESALVDRALMRSVAWKESRFDPDARSRAGAMGLVQLLPSTAALVARASGEPAPKDDALRDPALNLRLGARLLADLVARNEGRVSAALA